MRMRLSVVLALLVVDVYVARANPTSTGSQNASTTVNNHGIYLESYHDDYHEHYNLYTNGILAGTYDRYFSVKWTNGVGGRDILHLIHTGIASRSPDGYDAAFTNVYQATEWPRPYPDTGGFPIFFDDGNGNYVAGHNALTGMQSCDAEFAATYPAGESSSNHHFEE